MRGIVSKILSSLPLRSLCSPATQNFSKPSTSKNPAAMADVVQFCLERMADELDDLERRGLFTRTEIAEIVKSRCDFEFRLKCPSLLKQDYLLYVEYEQQLDALRNLRKRKIIGDLENKKNKRKKWKKSISDIAGVLRILDVYRMAVMRYKGDLELWFKYLEFCRERKRGRTKQGHGLHFSIRGSQVAKGTWNDISSKGFQKKKKADYAYNGPVQALRREDPIDVGLHET